MAVDFLSDEQAAGFGRFPDEVSAEDLERFCWLDDADLSVVGRRRGMHNRLGFAVQLITVRAVGRFLTDPLAVPWPVVESLAGQLGIADASVLKLYAQRGQTGYEHAAEISAVYGYVEFADPARHEELRLFLSARTWTSTEGPVRLFERAALWLREHKVLLPGVSTLTRLVSEVRAGSNDRLHSMLVDAAGPALILELEGLLHVGQGSRLTAWELLRTGPSMMLNLLASLAEYERELIVERVNAGIAAARQSGTRFGRPLSDPAVIADKLAIAKDARARGRTAEDAARLVGWSRATLYRHLGQDSGSVKGQ